MSRRKSAFRKTIEELVKIQEQRQKELQTEQSNEPPAEESPNDKS